MPFHAGFRRPKIADTTRTWAEQSVTMYATDHPRYPNRYDAYLPYLAFLTAGIVEYQWTEGAKPDRRAPFVPLGRAEEFLPDLHRKMRSFRQCRHIDGPASSELVRHSYELLGFLTERIPGDNLECFLATARAYIKQNEDECLSS